MCLLLPHPSTELITVKLKSCARLKKSSELLLYPSLQFAGIFLKPRSIPAITRPLVRFRRATEKVEPGPAVLQGWPIRPHSSACTSCIALHVAFGCLNRKADFHTDLQNSLTQPTLDSRLQFPPIKIPRKFSFIIFKSIKTYYHFPGASIKIRATNRSCENMNHEIPFFCI